MEQGEHRAQAELPAEAEPDVEHHQADGDEQGDDTAGQQFAGHLGADDFGRAEGRGGKMAAQVILDHFDARHRIAGRRFEAQNGALGQGRGAADALHFHVIELLGVQAFADQRRIHQGRRLHFQDGAALEVDAAGQAAAGRLGRQADRQRDRTDDRHGRQDGRELGEVDEMDIRLLRQHLDQRPVMRGDAISDGHGLGAEGLVPPGDQHLGHHDRREHRGEGAEHQGDGEALHRAGAEEVHDRRGHQGGDVGVENGFERAAETGIERGDQRAAGLELVTDTFVDQHVGVDGHGQGQDQAGDARQGQGRLHHRHAADQQDQVDQQRHHRDAAEQEAVG